jgi:hypothetical protein
MVPDTDDVGVVIAAAPTAMRDTPANDAAIHATTDHASVARRPREVHASAAQTTRFATSDARHGRACWRGEPSCNA